jgi:HMG (high mobility group) box
LSAYNYFFAATRRNLLDNRLQDQMRGIEPVHDPSAAGFSGLARTVAAKWKALDEGAKAEFVALAEQDRERYKRELSQYNNRIRAVSSSEPTDNVVVATTDVLAKIDVPPTVASSSPQGPLSKKVTTPKTIRKHSNANVIDLTNGKVAAIVSQSNNEASKDPSVSNHLANALGNDVKVCDEADMTKVGKAFTVLEQPEQRLGHMHHPYFGSSPDFLDAQEDGQSNLPRLSMDGNRKRAAMSGSETLYPDLPATKVQCTDNRAWNETLTTGYEYETIAMALPRHNDCHSDFQLSETASVHMLQDAYSHRSCDQEALTTKASEFLPFAMLEPLSLQDEIQAQGSFDSSNGTHTNDLPYTNSSTRAGDQIPSTVDRLLSVWNKEDCELLVRRFSE